MGPWPCHPNSPWLAAPGAARTQRVSGAWVFRSTRVPVAALFENLEDGSSLAEFVELFPGVTPEQARLVAHASSIQRRSRNC
ncbi:MAG: DUF433 domain-containing protein [Cyanobium sp.]